MASSSGSISLKIVSLCLFILLLSLSGAVRPVNSIPEREFDSMLGALRARGYNLFFSNAITTSDLHLQLLSDSLSPQITHGNNTRPSFFTLFAPTNSALFALGMTQTASSYTDTLRLHIVPRRLTLSGLRSLASLPTLLPSRSLRVTTRPVSSRHGLRSTRLILSVDNIDVVFPGLYYGRYVAVHGLNGALSLGLQSPLPQGFPHPDHSSTRRPHRFLLPVNRATVSSVPDVALNNRTSRMDFAEANCTTPESEGINRYSPAETTGNLVILQPEDHIPAKHSRSIWVSLLETGNGDDGHESSSEAPSPSMDVLEDGMITVEKPWLLDEQSEDYTITDSG
ncbi:uncharacterized protein LOC122309683 [Carya illinoinensis]|uniref:FAS1 domain-containing protein n=1 Tax=Carya illinoinensis TaxID=32201 RepID=A0A8T1QF01_CARIL|nr:uncharacterized protein LOC122309683 [Carya illinoinensis]KAG6652953.1 hypothetical protein CIPAW_05G041500 [Carya illinoinensis]